MSDVYGLWSGGGRGAGRQFDPPPVVPLPRPAGAVPGRGTGRATLNGQNGTNDRSQFPQKGKTNLHIRWRWDAASLAKPQSREGQPSFLKSLGGPRSVVTFVPIWCPMRLLRYARNDR